MPYTDDPQNVPADQVRFFVGDTNTSNEELTDPQIAFLLAEEGDSALRAAARAAEILAAKYSGIADEKQVGPLRLKFSERSGRYSALAKQLWARASASSTVGPYAGGISVVDKQTKEADSDRVKPSFKRGMMDYPAGTVGEEERLG